MSLEADRFSAALTVPIMFEGERQDIALREAQEVITMPGDDGQRFAGLHFNRDFESNPAIVRLGAMFDDIHSEDLRYIGYQLAAANPENPVLVMGLPAHGGSDALTDAQRREIRTDRGLTLVANSLVTAAGPRLGDGAELVAVGQSTGARLAPDFTLMAGEAGFRPAAMVGFNSVGLDRRPSFSTFTNFVVDGVMGQKAYHEGFDNLKMDSGLARFKKDMAAAGFDKPHDALANAIGIFRTDPSYFGFLVARSPLSADSGFEAIAKSLDAEPEMLAAFVSGGVDKVTRWTRIEPRVRQLVDHYDGRLSWDVWPDDGHAMGISTQQPRFAAAIRSVVRSLPGQG